jgi:ABC-2 type transport system permease protein
MSPRRLFAIAYKETLQIVRDPRSLAIALLMPLMQLVLLGYGVSLDIRHVPICIDDQEQSQNSRELVASFVSSGWFSVSQFVGTDRGVKEALDRGSCVGVVTLPVDFSRILTNTGTASIQAVFDGSDTNTTNIATGYAQGIVAEITADFETHWTQAHGTRPQVIGTVDVEPRVWFNEALDSRNFIIPGVVAVIIALVGAQLTSLTVSREWERGTMEQLISTPVTSLELMFGKILPYFVVATLDASFCLGAAVFWFGVPFRGGLGPLACATVLYTLVVLGIGYVTSVRIRSQLGASQIALLLTTMPITMLSGYTFPIDQMPKAVQAISLVVYARYFVTILRSIFLKGSSIVGLWGPMSALVIYAAVIALIAARAFRKRLD